jgi:hypothetical protein
MLIRMTRTLRTRFAQLVGVVLALFASSAMAAGLAQTSGDGSPRMAIVVAGEAAQRPDVVAHAKTAVASAASDDAELRVVHTSADELGATHMLAVRGYDKVITVGVDRRIAVAPVAKRFPGTQFVAVSPSALARGDYL